MKTLKFVRSAALLVILALAVTSCHFEEDPGPIQQATAEYSLSDFDRLDMGDALIVTVTQGTAFSIEITGDKRNLDDLVIKKSGSTLEAKYKDGWRSNRNRQYPTYVTIAMPALAAVRFSGAVTASVAGFETDDFHASLSGASDCNLNIAAGHTDFDLSGASDLIVVGSARTMRATLSGASGLSAMEFSLLQADIDASGASTAKVNASEFLKARASGASDVLYRGTPVLDISTSGASDVHHE